MYPHRIRLRGPWEVQPLARAGAGQEALPGPARMTLPCRWGEGGLADFTGRVRFRRSFGYPGQIDDHERVWLTVAALSDRAHLVLNDTPLGWHEGEQGPWEKEITDLLRPRNLLTIDVEGQAETGGLWGETALEVRCRAYLRDVQARLEREGTAVRVVASGTVAGSTEDSLDLYLLGGRRTLACSRIQAGPAGRTFRLEGEQLSACLLEEAGWLQGADLPVRIELVRGSAVWYRHELLLQVNQ